MKKVYYKDIDKALLNKKDKFLSRVESTTEYKSDLLSYSMNFDWVDVIEEACPNIDEIVRKPKLTLIKETETVPVEKAKKVNVESVKDLAKHTSNINDFDAEKNEYNISKILEIRNEETYNIYENRFLYTLIHDMNRFVLAKDKELNNLDLTDSKKLTYNAETDDGIDKIKLKMEIESKSIPKDVTDDLKKQIKEIKKRVKRIKEYLQSWLKSELITSLTKQHILMVKPPVKPTNIILKNPHFKVAVRLWEYIRYYDLEKEKADNNNLNSKGNNFIEEYLKHSFLIDYYVLDSISKRRRDEKEKMIQYALIMLNNEFYKILDLLKSYGIEVDENEFLEMILNEFKKNRDKEKPINNDNIKKKFKNAFDEYLERTQENL